MKTIKELIAERNTVHEEQKKIVAGADAEARSLTEDESKKFDDLQKRFDDLTADIERRQKLEKQQSFLNSSENVPSNIGFNSVQVGDDLAAKKPFASLGEQLRAIYLAATDRSQPVDKRLLEINEQHEKRAAPSGMHEGLGSAGGFALQPDFAGSMMETAATVGDILPLCDTYQPGSNEAKWMDIDETSVATTVFGGVQVYRAAEANSVTASKPVLKERSIRLEKLMGLAYATDEMMEDTNFIGGLLGRAFTVGIQRTLEGEIISGTGVGQCLGILNSSCLVSQAKETGQAAATIVFENISKIWSRVLRSGRANSVWLVHPDAEETLSRMTLVVGTGGVPVYLPAGGASTTGYAALFGRPVVPTDHCSALGTAGDIICANLKDYMLLTKGGVKTDTSIHVKFTTGEQAFRFTFRANGAPKRTSALTIKNSSNTHSSFVTVATRA